MVGNDLKLGNDGDQQWRVQYYWKRINTTETNLHAWVPFSPNLLSLPITGRLLRIQTGISMLRICKN